MGSDAIKDSPAADVDTAAASPAARTPEPVAAPELTAVGVGFSFYHDVFGALRVVVDWPGEQRQDMPISDAVPPDELKVLSTVMGRILLLAREKVGAR